MEMTQAWKLTIWGVRGSMPAPKQDRLKYGGHTSCFSVDCGKDLVVFDAGSGLIELSRRVLGQGKALHIFISHVHIDHLMGLFTMPQFHIAGEQIHLYGEARYGIPFRKQLETLIGPPYWPVGFANFQADITIHEIEPDQTISLPGGEVMRTLRGNHPDQSLLYRLEGDGHSFVYTLDCELTEELRPRLLDFCKDAGVLVWDANFNTEGLECHPGWGHSSMEQGAALGREAKADITLLTHYNQSYTDQFLAGLERRIASDTVRFAREGMEVSL